LGLFAGLGTAEQSRLANSLKLKWGPGEEGCEEAVPVQVSADGSEICEEESESDYESETDDSSQISVVPAPSSATVLRWLDGLQGTRPGRLVSHQDSYEWIEEEHMFEENHADATYTFLCPVAQPSQASH
jgi:hypothetical protein